MNRRTWTVIGATLVLLGLGVLALGLMDQESAVRQVQAVVGEPLDHQSGTYTLVGVPQPERLPDGEGTRANPDHRNTTRHVVMWKEEGRLRQSTLELHVENLDDGTVWTLTNRTTDPSTQEEVGVVTETWSLPGRLLVFQIQDFSDPGTRVWAVYDGVLRDPLQPKPSQFEGRLLAALPDGTPLPPGALVYGIDELTMQCSSKFIPDDHEPVETAA